MTIIEIVEKYGVKRTAVLAALQRGAVKGEKQDGLWQITEESAADYAERYRPHSKHDTRYISKPLAPGRRHREPKSRFEAQGATDAAIMSAVSSCRDCGGIRPPSGWALPFYDDNGRVIVVCNDCYEKRLIAA